MASAQRVVSPTVWRSVNWGLGDELLLTSYAGQDILSGNPGHLTLEQSAILAQFKEDLGADGFYDPEKHDDPKLLRFLRARTFDLQKSKAMWINTFKWRDSFGVDDLYENFEYPEKAEVNEFCHKVDNVRPPNETPVNVADFDMPKLLKITTPERQLKSLVVELETILRDRFPACSQVAGRRIDTTLTVIDVKGVGFNLFWNSKEVLQKLVMSRLLPNETTTALLKHFYSSVSQDHYPEMVGKVLVINAPYLFSAIWGVLKRWLSETTVSRIEILGTDYKSTLLQHAPADSLPKFLGGTCACPGGCSLSDAGPWEGKVRNFTSKKEIL
ncbi:hypothetical protein P7C70_g1150, partial [Phenoliferia sp. Uapishka_3]